MSKRAAKDGRYPPVKGGVPMKDWVQERVFDSADYLDRKPPRYEGDAPTPGKAAADAADTALRKPRKR